MTKASSKIIVTLVKSLAGRTVKLQASIRGLGLKKIGQTSELENTPSVRGMVKKTMHMLKVKE